MFNFLKKGFNVDLEETIKFPTSKKICSAIEAYCVDSEEKCEFVSTEMPVTFKLYEKLYSAHIKMARGGYYIRCREE